MRQGRLLADELLQGLDSRLEAAALDVEVGQQQHRFRHVGRGLGRQLELGLGLLEVARPHLGQGELVVGARGARLQAHDLLELLESLRRLAAGEGNAPLEQAPSGRTGSA